MDWKRIKTILIIALVFINGLLIMTVYNDKKYEKTINLDTDDVINYLKEEEIEVNKDLLEVETTLPNLSLSLQIYDLNKSNDIFRKASLYRNQDVVNLVTTINLGKELSFTTEFDRFDAPRVSDDVIRTLGDQLIADLGLSLEDIYIKSIGHTDKKTILVYGQKVGGHVIRNSYMIIKYNNENLLEFNRVWYDVVSSNNIKKQFYETKYVLYKLVGEVYSRFPNRLRPLEVISIDLIYQLGAPNEPLTLDNLAVEGEAGVHWQITTSDGEEYLIDAIIE